MSVKSQPPALVHEPREMAFIAEARRLLAEAKTIDEVKRIRNLADAYRYCMKKRGDSLAAQNTASVIAVRADKRIGKLLGDMKETGERDAGKGGDRKSRSQNRTVKLSDLDTDKKESSRCQAASAIADEKFEEIVEEIAAAGKPVTTEAILKAAKAEAKKAADEAKRQQAAEDAAKLATEGNRGVVRHGDFREVADELADGSVSLIFTDPPYSRDSLPLYADLARRSRNIPGSRPRPRRGTSSSGSPGPANWSSTPSAAAAPRPRWRYGWGASRSTATPTPPPARPP
jgi:hypothetical protein